MMADIATLTMNPALDIATGTDVVRPADKLRCSAPRHDPGGGGINVARLVHRLGGGEVAIFPVGGPSGEMLQRLLRSEGVAFDAVPIAGLTRESFTVTERQSGQQYRFILPGPELSGAEQEQCLDRLKALTPAPHYLVVSGSMPPGIAPDFLKRVGHACAAMGARLVVDTTGPALEQAARCGIYLLKPSLRELELLTGRTIAGPQEETRAARELIARGLGEVIVLSLSERGALLVTADMEERFAALNVPICSTVGAGDSMVAAIVLGLFRGLVLRNAVRFGLAAGAAALMRPGTELAHRADVERLYATL